MATTLPTTESFVLSEAPSVKSSCVVCGLPIKHSLTETDQAVVLEIGYEPRTIIRYPGGRDFEEISRSYLHICPQTAASSADSFRGITLSQLAVL